MSKIRIALVILAGLLLTTSLFAQATRTWVSGVGDDANPCSRTAPCKTFAGAISKTAANGEISVLDPGGFGQVTITKGMRIDGHSFVSSVLGTSGNAIAINTVQNVELSHIQINGAGLGTNGVNVFAAGNVTLDNVDIINYTNAGVNVGAGTNVAIIDSNINNTGTNGVLGSTASGTAKIVVDHSFIGNCSIGVHSSSNTIITVNNSTVSNNTTAGFQADNTSIIFASNDTVNNNGAGFLSVNTGSIVHLFGNVVQQNGAGYNISGTSQIFSSQNNSIQAVGNTGTLQNQGLQ